MVKDAIWIGDLEDGKEKRMETKTDDGRYFMTDAELEEIKKTAREQGASEMRDAILKKLEAQATTARRAYDFMTIKYALEDIGPLSSIEDRVRRETVEIVRGYSLKENIVDPEWFAILDAIAEGREP